MNTEDVRIDPAAGYYHQDGATPEPGFKETMVATSQAIHGSMLISLAKFKDTRQRLDMLYCITYGLGLLTAALLKDESKEDRLKIMLELVAGHQTSMQEFDELSLAERQEWLAGAVQHTECMLEVAEKAKAVYERATSGKATH